MKQKQTVPVSAVMQTDYSWIFRRRAIRARILAAVTILSLSSFIFFLLR
ncbi:hypothetical protein [Filimonas effusa]|nr:hypothetical protein [Filimonas effusa]